jgi:hypothetical protein
MTTPENEAADGLRVGGWLPAPQDERGSRQDEDVPRRPAAHAAPDFDLDLDLDPDPDPVIEASPKSFLRLGGRPDHARRRALEAGSAVLAGAGRYVYQGRRRFGEIISPRRRRVRVAVIAVMALVAVLVVLTTTLGPEGTPPRPGRGLALPSGPPVPVPATADDGLGSATPAPRPSTTAPRRPPTTRPASPPSPTTPAGPKPVYHEAEAALLVGIAEVTPLADASGGRIVHNIGTDPYGRAGQISFTQVTVPKATRYALTVFYVSGEERYALLTINNQRQHQLRFPPSGGWDTVSSQTFTIELSAGRNSLTFSNPYAWAPRLDRISLLG